MRPGVVVIALTALAMATWSPPAIAAVSEDLDAAAAVNAAAAAVRDVGQLPGDVALQSDTSGSLVAQTPVGVVDVPSTANDSIQVRSAASGSGVALSLPVPEDVEVESADGNAVYRDENADTSFVIDPLEEGVRVTAILESPDAPHEISYSAQSIVGSSDWSSSSLAIAADGSVVVAAADPSGSTVRVLALVDTPWAVDASGKPVATWFTVDGSELVQHVSPTADAKYPVVADPTITVGDFQISWSIWTPNQLTVSANKRGTAALAVADSVVCAALALVPVIGPALAVICAITLGITSIASLYGYCTRLKLTYNPLKPTPQQLTWTKSYYKGGFCT